MAEAKAMETKEPGECRDDGVEREASCVEGERAERDALPRHNHLAIDKRHLLRQSWALGFIVAPLLVLNDWG